MILADWPPHIRALRDEANRLEALIPPQHASTPEHRERAMQDADEAHALADAATDEWLANLPADQPRYVEPLDIDAVNIRRFEELCEMGFYDQEVRK